MDERAMGPMEEAVNAHVMDHLVNGPAVHRPLMDAARASDAKVKELEAENERLRIVRDELAAALDAYNLTFMHGRSSAGPFEAHVTRAMIDNGRAALERAREGVS